MTTDAKVYDFCPSCGTATVAGHSYCGKCGNTLAKAPTGDANPPKEVTPASVIAAASKPTSKSPKKQRRVLKWGVLFLLVALVIAGVTLLVRSHNQSKSFKDGYSAGIGLTHADWEGSVQSTCEGVSRPQNINSAQLQQGCIAGLKAHLTEVEGSPTTDSSSPSVKTPEEQFAAAAEHQISVVGAAVDQGEVSAASLGKLGDGVCNSFSYVGPNDSALYAYNEAFQQAEIYGGTDFGVENHGDDYSTVVRFGHAFAGLAAEYVCPQYTSDIPYGDPGQSGGSTRDDDSEPPTTTTTSPPDTPSYSDGYNAGLAEAQKDWGSSAPSSIQGVASDDCNPALGFQTAPVPSGDDPTQFMQGCITGFEAHFSTG